MRLARGIIIVVLFVLPVSSFCFLVSKPKVLYDKNGNSILVMLFLENPPTDELVSIIKRNLDVTLFIEVKLVREDFGILGIQTEVTNINLYYKITYDFITENYIVFNEYLFKTFKSLSNMFDLIFYPVILKINLLDLRDNPDFTEIYEDTKFFIASKARIVYMNMRPPLNIIASLLGIKNYETELSYSEMFKIK